MQDFLEKYFDEYNYPLEARNAFFDAVNVITANKENLTLFVSEINCYRSSRCIIDFKESLKNVSLIAKSLSLNTETVEFLFLILCSEHLKYLYNNAGYSIEYFNGVMDDLLRKMNECYTVKHIWGSFVCDWLSGYFTLKRFAIGRLQFELSQIQPIVSPDGKYVFNNTKAVNVHIPSGKRLDIKEVKDAFNKAVNFFGAEFDDCVLFMCRSWLLFPCNKLMLDANSGICKFMDEFTIIRVDIDPTKRDLWRIFDTFDTENLDMLPSDTSLQRAYKEWLRCGNPVGNGFGIKYIKKL